MSLRRHRIRRACVRHALIGLLTLAAWVRSDAAVERGDAAVVVYNSRSADSRRVAESYALKRGVPSDQVLALEMPLAEAISRAEFRNQLQEPLFAWLVRRGLFSLEQTDGGLAATNRSAKVRASKIRYAVLCYGVPLKIQADPALVEDVPAGTRSELRRNEAAVDSELVWLPRLREGMALTGLLTNAFYGVTSAAPLHPTNGVLLVARLDGANAEIAGGLVDKALAAERDGLWGRAYVDARGIKAGSLKAGEDLMHGAAVMCSKAGYDVVVDLAPQTFGREFPLSQVALYAGWYDGDVSGPFRQPGIEFMPGAFAYHLHSFSAATLRSTNSHWAGPLLARGATVTLGSVYEPYLSGTSDVATLLRNWLLHGFSFGEAAWSAEFGFSWQTTVVGDPLYRPWNVSLEARRMDLEQRNDRRAEWPIAIQLDRQLSSGKPLAVLVAELNNLPLTRSSAVLSEKLGDLLLLQNKPADASAAYRQALHASPSPRQQIRLLLARANLESATGADGAALECLKEIVEKCPDYGEQLEFQRRLLLLAIKAGDEELTKRCHAAIRRLSGSDGAVGPRDPVSQPSPPSSTNR